MISSRGTEPASLPPSPSLPPSHDKKIYFATIYNCCNCQEIKVVSSTSGRFMSQGFITIKANGSFFSFDI